MNPGAHYAIHYAVSITNFWPWANGEHGDPAEPWDYSGATQYFLCKLIEKGVIPEEHPIMVQVSW